MSDGTKVAVKVQRPNIEEVIELDLAMLLDLARFIERHVPEISGVNPIAVVAEANAIVWAKMPAPPYRSHATIPSPSCAHAATSSLYTRAA